MKWLAKETLEHRIYSLKTDVWAYGIMCWEVYADGAEPYPGLTNIQTRAKIVIQDYRMEMPKVGNVTFKFIHNILGHSTKNRKAGLFVLG